MNTCSERGQGLLVLVLGLGVVALLILAMTGNLPGMKKGADAIGESVGNQIDGMTTTEPEIDLGTVMSAWVNNQRIYPNKHALERHETDAILTANCYNDHGAFFVQANHKTGDWYIHCLEEDGKTVRTTFWTRIGNQFHMKNAYTKGDGFWPWSQIKTYFESKWGAFSSQFPSDGVLYIDGVPAPYVP
jgi:hypothetical protein